MTQKFAGCIVFVVVGLLILSSGIDSGRTVSIVGGAVFTLLALGFLISVALATRRS